MIRVAVTGAKGRMGSNIIRTITQQKDMLLVAAIEKEGDKDRGKDIGELLGIGKLDVALSTSDELEEVLKSSKADVLVDFTFPEPCLRAVKIASKNNVNLVIGTTGFTKEQITEIENAVKENNVSAVLSPNMATGVNVFFKIVEQLAKILGEEYDVEIIEAHHRFKKDAPSGTALKAAELIANALNINLEENAIYGRRGFVGERKKGIIGLHAVRAGDIVGEHTVLFAGEGERLEITHRAHSRQAFVNGAIKAIRFIHGKKDGKIYSTFDVLGLR